jgi:hypothetical protein
MGEPFRWRADLAAERGSSGRTAMSAPVENIWTENLAMQTRTETTEQIDYDSIMRWEDDGKAVLTRRGQKGDSEEEASPAKRATAGHLMSRI